MAALDVRVYSAAQQIGGAVLCLRRPCLSHAPRDFPPMPELPEVETTRRGLVAHVQGRRIAALRVYDPRLRWPVPAGPCAAGRGPHDRSRRSPQQVPALSPRRGHAARPPGHDGEPARVHGGAAAPAARPRRHRARQRRDRALPRSAALRRDAVGARDGRGAPAARPARARALRRRVRRRLPVVGDAPARRGDQARADGQPPRRRRGEHLRQRGAVPRRHPADDAGAPAVAGTARHGSCRRCGRR